MAAAAAAAPDPKPVLRWASSDVASFIRSLNSPHFGGYALAFERDGVDGQMLVYDIDDEWINSHISNPLHRKRIVREIDSLRQTAPGSRDEKSAAVPGIAISIWGSCECQRTGQHFWIRYC